MINPFKIHLPLKSSILILLLGILVSFPTSAQRVKIITVEVEPYKTIEFYEHFKRTVLKTEPTGIGYIEDFDFEWGYRYTLRVKSTKLRGVLSDGTSHDYSLEKVVKKERVSSDYEFRLYLDYQRYYYPVEDTISAYTFKWVNDSSFIYFEDVNVEIPAKWLDSVKKLKTSPDGRRARFVFTKPDHLRLIGF